MPKRRTRKRITGGNPAETKFREYASKIANKEPVSIVSFSAFLDSVDDPLKVAIDYDKTGKPYTINEYALLHNASYDIHAVFWKYEVALTHLVDYSSLFDIKPAKNSIRTADLYSSWFVTDNDLNPSTKGADLNHHRFKDPLTILEAYIIHGEHSENILRIIENIKDNNIHILFRHIPKTGNIPTVLFFTLESSNYVNKPLATYNYNMIVQLYLQTRIYDVLLKNYSQLALINIAIRFNKPDLLQGICMKISNSNDVYKYLFHNSSVTFLLLQNNPSLFDATFNLLRIIDHVEVFKYINMYATDSSRDISLIMEKYIKQKTSPSPTDAKRFFELLGRHTLPNILEPYTGSKVRIIIRCHGVLAAETKRRFDFPFSRLCYFISKGQTLGEACFVSNRTENMICNGNYDDNLQCVESANGKIESEPMKFLFDSGFFLGTRNKGRNTSNGRPQSGLTGIYVCREGTVDRANELDIQEDTPYSLEDIVGLCNAVCRERQIDPANVDILLFSCRTRLGKPQEVVQVNPKLVVKI